MPTFLLIFPAVVLGVLQYLRMRESPTTLDIGILVGLGVFVAAVYTFSHQINFWWYKKFPPRLPKAMKAVLLSFYPYYSRLNSVEKKRFEDRLAILKIDKDFLPQEFPKMPDDIRHLMLAAMVQITFGKKDFLMTHWGVFAVYRQAFHSPNIQEFHTGEVHYEDGVILLATDPFIEGINRPNRSYDIGIHYLAKAYQYEANIQRKDFLFFEEKDQEQFLRSLAQIRGRATAYESDYADKTPEDDFGLCVEHFFHAPQAFKEHLPETFKALQNILNQNPLNAEKPIIEGI